MASLDPEGPQEQGRKRTYESEAESTGADAKFRRQAEENQRRAYEARERAHRFRAFATSPVGASVVLATIFVIAVVIVLIVQWWVEIESGTPASRNVKTTRTSDTRSFDTTIESPELKKEIEPVRSLTDSEKAEAAFRSGDYQAALDQINALEPGKQSSQEEMIRALSHVNLGQEEAALQAFQQAIEKREQNHAAWFQWGQYLRKLGRYEEALPKMRRALDLDPNNELYRAFWGVTQVQAGLYWSLLWDAEKAIYVDPAPGDWLMITAAICLEVGDLPQALTMMRYAETRMVHREFKTVLADPFFQKFRYDENLRLFYSQVFL